MMRVNSIINDVKDGAITSITYETLEEGIVVQRCRINFQNSGETGVVQSSQILTDNKDLIEKSFECIKATLKSNGVKAVDIHTKNSDKMVTYTL